MATFAAGADWTPIRVDQGSLTAQQSTQLGGANQTTIGTNLTPTLTVTPKTLTGNIVFTYRTGTSPDHPAEDLVGSVLHIDLTPGLVEDVVPGSIRFGLAGKTYIDRVGTLYTDVDPATGAGMAAGAVTYSSGSGQLTAWPEGQANSVALQALATTIGRVVAADVIFRAPTAPLRPGSVQITAAKVGGGSLSVTAPESGIVDANDLAAIINYETGVHHLRFGNWIVPAGHEAEWWYDVRNIRASDGKIWKPTLIYVDTLRFNGVAYAYVPMPASRIGVNANRFPGNGQVPIFRVGDAVVVHHTQTLPIGSPVTPGQVVDLGRPRVYSVQVIDANGAQVPAGPATWTADLLAGTLTFAASLNLGTAVQPLSAIHRVLDQRLIVDLDISGRMAFNKPLSHAFAAGESYVSSAVELGNFVAGVALSFTQETWTGVWADALIGNEPTMQYDSANFPLLLTDAGAIHERWAMILTGTTTYKLISEHLGTVAQGISVNADFAPVNPLTGQAYFTARAGFLGLGGSVGNVLRFNTTAADRPAWPIVTVLPGENLAATDSFEVQIIGNSE